MGTQIQFFMHEHDEREFLAYLLGSAPAVLLEDISCSEQPAIVTDPYQWLSGPTEKVWIHHQGLAGSVKTRDLKTGRHYMLDQFNSDAVLIEFVRSRVWERGLGSGRLWCEPSQFQEAVQGRKWFQRLAGWLRRQSGGNKHRGIIMLPHAARWAEQGGRLA